MNSLEKSAVKLDDLKPGVSVRIFYNAGNPNNRRIHIRAIVDDDYFVLRCWSRGRQGWMYSVYGAYRLGLLLEAGRLRDIKQGEKGKAHVG